MERSIEYVQKVQDAFAHHCNLSITIVDTDGHIVTTPSNGNKLFHLLYQQVVHKLSKWKKTSIVDVHPGLQLIISPITYAGETRYYILSGVCIEKGTRSQIIQYLEAKLDSASEWTSAVNEIEERTNQQKQQAVESINGLAQIINQLHQSDVQREIWQHIISGLAEASELAQMNRTIKQLLDTFKKLHHRLDFVGFAMESKDSCVISQIIGDQPFHLLLGSSFTMGEGFLGHTLAMAEMGYWEDIQLDPRSLHFTQKNIHPRALVCYPIVKDQSVLGVLFAGSCTDSQISKYMLDIGQVMANILSIHLSQQVLRDEWLTQQQRVNAVMEVCQLISRTRDRKKLAFMLVDMSLNITQAKFAAVALFDQTNSAEEIRMVSRGLTSEQSDKYGKILLNSYSASAEKLQDTYHPARTETNRNLEWGATVMEFPIVNERMYGLLCISAEEHLVHQKAFISSLATIGGLAIQLAHQAESEINKLVSQLLQAAKFWDEKAYQFAYDLKEWVMKFIDFLQLPIVEIEEIENACLLSLYSPDFIKQNIPEAEGLYQIIKDYDQLFRRKEEHPIDQRDQAYAQEGAHLTNYTLAGKILALVAAHLTAKGKSKPRIIGVEEELQEKFTSFLLSIEVHDQQIKKETEIKLDLEQLSKREQEVAQLVMQGLHNKEIAYELFISEHTVKNHITNIYNKLGVSDRASLMAYFYHRKK